jgi:hypothetical protein
MLLGMEIAETRKQADRSCALYSPQNEDAPRRIRSAVTNGSKAFIDGDGNSPGTGVISSFEGIKQETNRGSAHGGRVDDQARDQESSRQAIQV